MSDPSEESLNLINKFYELLQKSRLKNMSDKELAEKQALICLNIVLKFMNLEQITYTKEIKQFLKNVKSEIKNHENKNNKQSN